MTAAAFDARPWLVSRPAAAGRALADALRATGRDVRWVPAFDIGPAPDELAARAALARLDDADLAIFVSPAAVRATQQLLGGRAWPTDVSIGAVGSATADAVRALLGRPDGAALTLIAPEPAPSGPTAARVEPGPDLAVDAPADASADRLADDGDSSSGSEAFWQALQPCLAQRRDANRPLRRVLLLRAAQGRDWLLDQLRTLGAQVDPVAVYARRARPWDVDDTAWIAARLGGSPPILVVTSSEAVDALIEAASDALPAALPWLRRGRALALHPRIVERLRAAGFADAACVACTAESLLAAA